MKKHLLLLVLSFLMTSAVVAQQTLLGYFSFPTQIQAPSTPTSFTANGGMQNGTATLYADGTNGSSTFSQVSSSNTELNMYGGSTVNGIEGEENSSAFTLVNSSANGKSIVIRFSTIGFQDIVLSFATRGTTKGFDTHVWSYSTDGEIFTPLSDNNTAVTTSSFVAKTVDFSSVTALNNQANVYLKLTVSGASDVSGNNRLDNIQINAVSGGPDITAPEIAGMEILSGSSITLTFNEPVDQTIAETATNYSMTGGITVSTASLVENTVTLTFASAMTLGTEYNLTVSNIQDIAGNIMPDSTLIFTYQIIAPEITDMDIVSATSIQLTFNESLDQTIAETIGNYTVAGGISVSAASLAGNVVTLTLTPAMEEGIDYSLTVSNIQSVGGGIMPDSTLVFYFGVPAANIMATIADLKTKMILNENENTVGTVVYKLTGEVVITAIGSQRNQKWIQDGTGAVLIDDPSGIITTTMEDGDKIQNIYGTLTNYYGLLEFVPTQNVATVISQNNEVTPLTVTTTQVKDPVFMIEHQSELMQLSNVIFTDANGTATFANSRKYRLNPGSTEDSLIYTSIHNVVSGVIPMGEQNITGLTTFSRGKYYLVPRSNSDIVAAADISAPEITAVEIVSATSIELTFNEPIDQTIAETVTNYTLTGGITISNAALATNVVTLTLNPGMTLGSEYTLTVQNIQDLAGNIMGDSSLTLTYYVAPPEITNLEVVSATSITLTFNEVLNQTTAETIANYTLTGGITVTAATLASDVVTLTLTPAMTSGIQYTLTVSNIQNLEGIAMVDSSLTCMYNASPGHPDLLAYFSFPTQAQTPNTPTSFLADGGVQAETAGLYLDGTHGSSTWMKNGELNMFVGSSLNLLSGGTATYDLALLNPSANGKSMVFHLSTTGYQNIVLSYATRSSNTNTSFDTHSWSYSTDGSAFTPVEGNTANFAASYAVKSMDFTSVTAINDQPNVYLKLTISGADPGAGTSINNRIDNVQINGVSSAPDVTAPVITNTEVVTATSIKLTFNESLNQSIAETASNYTLTGGITVSTAVLTANTVTLTLDPALSVGTPYTLTVQHIQDLAGNVMADSSQILTYEIPAPEISNMEVVSATSIQLTFNESLDQTIAETATNYTLTGGITVSTAVLASDVVTLTLTPALTTGTEYSLTVANIQNSAGAVMPDSTLVFTYVIPPAEPELLAYFSFPTQTQAPNTVTSFIADGGDQAGTAMLYANGTHGSSTFTQTTGSNTELNMFTGTVVNAVTGTSATFDLAVVSPSANGKSIVFSFATNGYQDIVLTYATRSSNAATSFNTHSWAYSTDGGNVYTPISGNTANSATSYAVKTLDLSSIAEINDQDNVCLRLTVSGATGTGALNNRFDNIQINAVPVGPDVYPPKVVNTQIVSGNSVKITFNELVKQDIAENPAHYVMNGGAAVLSATLTNREVTLSLDPGMTEGVEYALTISNIQDTTGNVMQDSTLNLMYGVPSTNWVANIGELKTKMVLNPDETTTGTTVYKLTGEVTVTTIGSQRNQKWIQDATGAILIDDQAGVITTTMTKGDNIENIYGTLTNYFGLLEFIPVQNVSSVISQGNEITPLEITTAQLKDPSFMVGHQSEVIKLSNVVFTDADGALTFTSGKKYRLEPGTINDSLVYLSIYDVMTGIIPSGEQDIVGVNTLSRGKYYIIPRGNSDITPSPDLTAPAISSMQVVSATSIRVTFDEPLNQAVAETAGNYAITGGLTVSAATHTSGVVMLMLSSAMTAEEEYSLTVSNMEDIAGNVMSDSTITFTYHAPIAVSDIAGLKTKMTLDPNEITTGSTVYLLTGEVTVTAIGSQRGQKWIQDATGAVLIEDPAGIITTALTEGDNVENIYGTLTNYYGLLQFIPVQNIPSVISQGNQIAPLLVTTDELKNNSFMENHQSELIKLERVAFTDANGTLAFANGKKYCLNPGTVSDSLVYLNIYNVVTGTVPSGENTIIGVNTLSQGHYYIIPRGNQDIISTDGIAKNNLETISIYPNPATDHIVIKTETTVNIELYNSMGLLLVRQQYPAGSNILERENFPVGLYMIKVIDKQTVAEASFKLIFR